MDWTKVTVKQAQELSYPEYREWLLAQTNCFKRGLGLHDYKMVGTKLVCQRVGCGKVKDIRFDPLGFRRGYKR